MFVSNHVYAGRVIFPATERKFQNGKSYLTFTVYVNGALKTKDRNNKKGESLRVSCSYIPFDEKDSVAIILSNIASKDHPGQGGLNGQEYKSVEVLVEGAPRFGQVMDQNGSEVKGAVYISLDNCKVRILDRAILDLYYGEFGGNKGESSSEEPASENVPTKAPTQSTQRSGYKTGDRVKDAQGVEFELTGTDFRNPNHWTPVSQLQPTQAQSEQPVLPSAVVNRGTTSKQSGGSLMSVLGDAVAQDEPSMSSKLPI